jgi:hypothetical protein
VSDSGWDDGHEPDEGDDAVDITSLFDDLSAFFDDLGPGNKRPDDYVGPEIQTILQTLENGCRAGKSYRPDPSGRRRAVKAADYKAGTKFFATTPIIEGLEDLYWLLVELASDPTAFLVRGVMPQWAGTPRRLKRTGEYGHETVRRLVSIHGYAGAFEGVPRQLLMIDLDGIPLPAGFNVVNDPEACVTWAVDNLLPPEFADASFVYQLSSSAGLTKADDELSVHLWFFTERPFWDEEFRDWAHWWNAKQQSKIIDPALYNPVQPHYVNDPELLDGLVDPLAGRRLRWVRRLRKTVALYMPTPEDVAGEGRLKGKRAAAAARAAYKKKAAADGEPRGSDLSDADNADESVAEAERSQIGAVRDGPGYRGYLRMIGYESHIRTQIRAAVGSYFHERGSRADRRVLKEAIRQAIDDSPFLDCGEPWSRRRQEALDYLEGGTDNSNVDEMIADIARYQAARERSAHQVCEPLWPMPSLDADDAYAELYGTACLVILSVVALRQQRLRDAGNPLGAIGWLFNGSDDPAQRAALCEPGVGKTEAMINWARNLLRADATARIVIAVPTHKLGHGLATRINEEYGEDIALEWNGTDQPDPQAPEQKMCRRADAAADLIAAGGELQLLCSSKTSCCPHHPSTAGSQCCGYQRQQLQARQGIRAWILPATMLTSAPPVALRRSNNRAILGDFDLLVIDEAPWFAFLGGHDAEPEGAPSAWLNPNWWQEQETKANAENKHTVLDTLTRLHGVIASRDLGEIPEQALFDAGINADDVARARRILWRWKQDLRPLVRPGATRSVLNRAIAAAAQINQRVLAVGNLLDKVARRLRGDLAPSGLELIDHPKSGGRFLRLRWRKDIHPAWLKAPVLYLDAAGTGAFELAKAWLPRIELAVEARAKAPYMRVAQITDSQMGYARIPPSASPAENAPPDKITTGDRNAEKLARVVEVLGREGLAVCPKELRDTWEEEGRLPGWALWNFGAIRGRDEARDVRRLVVISRPLPGPAIVELMAETIYARRVQRMPAGEWYPKSRVGRLMADGTGRVSLSYRHPDPQVEAVRFAICEAELIQAIGRGRGVRREEDNPLDVLLLTDVPLPLPVTKLTTWKDLSDEAGPVEVLAARGVLPLDYEGMAAALPNWFTNDVAAREWFRYRPEAFSRLGELRARAKAGASIAIDEFRGNPYKNLYIGNSPKVSVFRYRRSEDRQSKLVLVDTGMHRDARAAVEAVLGPVDVFRPV